MWRPLLARPWPDARTWGELSPIEITYLAHIDHRGALFSAADLNRQDSARHGDRILHPGARSHNPDPRQLTACLGGSHHGARITRRPRALRQDQRRQAAAARHPRAVAFGCDLADCAKVFCRQPLRPYYLLLASRLLRSAGQEAQGDVALSRLSGAPRHLAPVLARYRSVAQGSNLPTDAPR